MNYWIVFAFLIFPYIALTILLVGHIYRYLRDPYRWNSKSSQLLEKRSLLYGSFLFHYGIILALIGHVLGLLVPQWFYTAIGISAQTHLALAIGLGIIFGWSAFLGLLILIARRFIWRSVRVNSSLNDMVTLLILLAVIGLGTFNVSFVRFENVLFTIAPWLRGILGFFPDPQLMADAPVTYKAHTLAAFALFAYYPFSRLVHIASAPLTYIIRVFVLFRKRIARP